MIRTLTLALSLAILLQNTCPFGLAAKTGFASPHTHCCCAKKASERQTDKNSRQAVSVKGPIFVFIGQREAHPCSFCSPERTVKACPDDFYRSITLNPPEEPPRIS